MSGKVYPLQGNQKAAVEPSRTVWLSASAGTGKTQVLSARVLRLLLQPGVEPEQLLCLTFTKAGAAEMATRVNEVLASWVRMDDVRLAADLRAIGAPFGPEALERARSRFAAVLDCPGGGLRIETIHAFSQWLLSAFPEEAGLRPGTRAMEDRDRDLLVRQVLADLLVRADEAGDTGVTDALSALSLRMAQDAVEAFLLRCAGAHALWSGPGAWRPPLRPRINRVLGLDADDDGAGLAELCADAAFDCASVRKCMEANARWGTATGVDCANILGDWLSVGGAGRLIGLDDFAKQFLTAKGEPKSARNLLKHEPAYAEYQARVIACIEAVRERKALVQLAEMLDPALTLGCRFALAWEEAKAREGFIDFDDQIRAAASLLTERASAEWIRFKLDRRFDHVLVDEAQDTNAAQWRIVLQGLVSDFFTGEGQHGDALRTLFVVGDYKQAIFRFQGTSPENFDKARGDVARQLFALAEATNDDARRLLDLGLGRSYRTASSILAFVDRAIHVIGVERFGLTAAPDPHEGEDRPGTVALWQVVGAKPGDDEDEAEETGEEGPESWLSRPDRDLADRIARQVRAWMESGFPLVKGGARRAGPGDVMVLVRKRKELAGLIVARLHAQGVPVAGVDRLRLGAPLAVKDLVAALRFGAQPLDDLNLANLLVSPLIGWSQEDLLRFAWRAPRMPLWEHLRAGEGPETHAAMEKLRALLARADYEPPAALLHWILVGPWQGRRALVARLGREANDPIDELLNAAMAYAGGNAPSLAGFLQWFDAGEGDIKREAGKNEGLVRVMTVHGSKGLQAPIVILADSADDPDKSPPRGLEVVESVLDAQRAVPLPALRKEERVGPVREAEAQTKKEEREEHWRLLYVAMTRAEEALFIAGSMGKQQKELPPDSWYAQLEPLFGTEGWIEDPLWGGRKQLGGPPALSLERTTALDNAPAILPEVLTVPIGPEPRPPRPLAPSSLGEDEAPDPPVRPGPGALLAARRGTLVHKLIERLPEVAPESRRAAGLAWLGKAGQGFEPGDHEAMVDAALAVLDNPDWQEAFGPGSLAEVPIAALVGTRIVSGTIDRLLITQNRVRIIDFKTGRRPPRTLEEIPAAYLRQMAAYVAALRVIHPGRAVEAALLYTHAPQLFALPDALLAAQKLELAAPEESFSG